MSIAPVVSVLFPARNAAPAVDRAIGSLLRQTFHDFEVVAVDDGSTDGTREIVARHAAADSRVRLVENDGVGLIDALRTAARHARTLILARMDADDVSHPTRLERQVEMFAGDPSLGLVATRVRLVRDEGLAADGFERYVEWNNSLLSPGDIAASRFIESPVVHPSVMMMREAYDRAGGYRDAGWAEDYDLWLRMLESGTRMAKTEEVLLDWHDSGARLTRADGRYSAGNFLRCRAHFVARVPGVRARGAMISAAGPTGKHFARLLRAEGIDVRAFVDVHPRRVGAAIEGVPVLGVESIPAASPEAPVQLAAAGKPEARARIRGLMASRGWTEGVDFWCVS